MSRILNDYYELADIFSLLVSVIGKQKRKNIRRVVFNCFDSAALFRFQQILICDYQGNQILT